jgi:hypothetical protein
MSVRYTATWYDVTQARQQEHTPYTQTRTGPAGRSSGQCTQFARWQKFRPKSSKGAAEIKICGRILARKSSANFQKHQFHNALYIKNLI